MPIRHRCRNVSTPVTRENTISAMSTARKPGDPGRPAASTAPAMISVYIITAIPRRSVPPTRRHQYTNPRLYQVLPTPGSLAMVTPGGSSARGGNLMLSWLVMGCLLYTSDAADDLLCVDLGGRRII